MAYVPRLLLAAFTLTLLQACGSSSVQTQAADPSAFEAASFQYYKWRSEPVVNTAGSRDWYYQMDPILRSELDAALADKGYRLDPERAEFSVDYVYAPGMVMGAKSAEATNIQTRPTAIPNRHVNQAVVDNAHALSGVKETSNIGLQFNRIANNSEIWYVVITKIVEDVNSVDRERLQKNIRKAIGVGLRTLPKAQ